MPTARSDVAPARPVMRPLVYAGSSQIIDAHTRQLVSPRTVVLEYNALLDIVQRVAILGGESDVVFAAQRLLREGARHD